MLSIQKAHRLIQLLRCTILPKRRLSSSAYNPLSKTRQTGIDPKWKDDFPWMVSVEDGTGMLCSVVSTLDAPRNQLLVKMCD